MRLKTIQPGARCTFMQNFRVVHQFSLNKVENFSPYCTSPKYKCRALGFAFQVCLLPSHSLASLFHCQLYASSNGRCINFVDKKKMMKNHWHG